MTEKTIQTLIISISILIGIYVLRSSISEAIRKLSRLSMISKDKKIDATFQHETSRNSEEHLGRQECEDNSNINTIGDNKDWYAYYRENDFENAYNVITKEIEEINDNEEKIKLESVRGFFLSKNKFDKIDDYFENLILKNSNSYYVYYWFARSYIDNNQSTIAISKFERGLEKLKDKTLIAIQYADYLVKINRLNDAIGLMTNRLNSEFYDSLYYHKLASLYKKNGNIDEMLKIYKHAYINENLEQKHIEVFAEELAEANKHGEALVLYSELEKSGYEVSAMACYQGNQFLELEFYDQSLACYKRALKKLKEGENGGWIYANIGNLYKNKGLYDKAIINLKKALSIEDEDEYSTHRLSSTYELKNKEKKEKTRILQDSQKYFT